MVDELIDTGRRNFLRASAGASLAGLVGFQAASARPSDAGSLQAGTVPDYADWLPADDQFVDEGEFSIVALDVDALLEIVAVDDGDDGDDDDDDDDEPTPLQFEPFLISYFLAAFSWPLGIGNYGFGEPILGQAVESALDDPVTTTAPADRHLAVGDVEVFTGSFDTEAVETIAVDAGFEASDREGVYVHEADGRAIAWGLDHFVMSEDVELVSRVVDAGLGTEPSRHETDDDFARLLADGGHGEFAMAVRSVRDELDFSDDGTDFFGIDYGPFEGVQGYAQSNDWWIPDEDTDPDTVDPDQDYVDATTVVEYADDGRVDEDRLEAVGDLASDRTQTRDGRFVTIEMTYSFRDFAQDDVPGEVPPDDDSGDDTRDDSDDGTGDDSDDETGDDSGDDTDDPNDERTDEGGDDDDTGNDDTDDGSPGFGVATAVASLGGLGYVLRRRLSNDDSATD